MDKCNAERVIWGLQANFQNDVNIRVFKKRGDIFVKLKKKTEYLFKTSACAD